MQLNSQTGGSKKGGDPLDQKQSIKIVTSTGDIEVNFYVTVGSTVTTQHVVITQNDTPIAHQSYDLNYPTGIHPASLDIWRRYERVRLGNLVIRSGFGLCGCYEYYDPYALPNPRHQESDTEHASGCVELIRSLETYYPNLLTPELYRRAEHLLKDHDLGENEYGDRPDDGSQNRSEKNQAELTGFALASARLPANLRATAISDFICFQDPTFAGFPEEIAHLVQLAKVVDKSEAVLSAIAYEKSGAPGDLFYKEHHYDTLTDQDRHFIRETDGDSSIAADWLAHVVRDYHSYYGFPYVLDIVRAAIIDVRGSWFPWFNNFCERNHIPKKHTTHPLL